MLRRPSIVSQFTNLVQNSIQFNRFLFLLDKKSLKINLITHHTKLGNTTFRITFRVFADVLAARTRALRIAKP
jgi:4-hydroxy-L-threonine phosphate dehydrogenase PdxA